MKLEKIHIYWCVVQIIFIGLYFEIAGSFGIDTFAFIGLELPILELPIIVGFIFGIATIPYYFAKKFKSIYIGLSVLNIISVIPYLVGITSGGPFLTSVFLSIVTFMLALYVNWKGKK